MKKLLVLFIISFTGFKAQIYTAKDGATTISFFSKAPLEDIEAVNKGATIVFKSTTGELQLSISIQNFKFKNALMEEHFNENYMETDKYPKCIFKGKINEPIDYTKDGENKVTVTGKMEIHGITKQVTLSGLLTKEGNDFKLSCKTTIHVTDYDIKVPSMYVKNIAETVDVTFNTTLEPFQKKP
jgi:polyisoprenoid-binding protein YceI